MPLREPPVTSLRAVTLAGLMLLAGCGQGVDDMIARTWCGFDGEAEGPFLRASGFRVDHGPAPATDPSAEVLPATVMPELRFVRTEIDEIRFHRDGTLEVTERSGEQWTSRYTFVSDHEIVYTGPGEREVREGVVVDGNTLALVRLDGNDALEVRRFVRALPLIPC